MRSREINGCGACKNILKSGGGQKIFIQRVKGAVSEIVSLFLVLMAPVILKKGLLLISIINTPFNFRVFPACLISIKPHTYPFHLPHQKELVCKKYANRNLSSLVRSASLYGTNSCKVHTAHGHLVELNIHSHAR